jgi:hypothetical protein
MRARLFPILSSVPLLSSVPILSAASGCGNGVGPASEGSSSGAAETTTGGTTVPTTGGADTSGSTDTGAASTTSDDTTTGEVVSEVGCNPLDPSYCVLPYPSMFHMAPADTETGWRISYLESALPVNAMGNGMDPKYLAEKDGFSVLGVLMFAFEDVKLEGVIGHEDLGAYLADDAKTVLIDAETGERVAHFVEIDATAKKASEALILAQPAVPLRHGKRYVFGVRGLEKSAGGPVATSYAFRSLRDDKVSVDPQVEDQRARYEADVFPVLADAGFAREELQIAWDFVTVSRENSLGRMRWLRDDLLAVVGAEGPDYKVSKVEDADCAEAGTTIGRTIFIDMMSPRYTDTDEPGAILTRDADGMPMRVGETEVEVVVRIPCSLIDQPEPVAGRLVQYGHGLLGGKGEVQSGYLGAMADKYGWVLFAVDWTGMKSEDTIAIIDALTTNPTNFVTIPERSMQGFTEFMAAMRLMSGKFVEDEAVTFLSGDAEMYSAIDPTKRSYYGNSQGGILGGAYLALSPDIERGVLGVGGMPYVLLLPRSTDFDDFFQLLRVAYPDHRDIMLLLALFQNLWDPGEGAGWAWAMNAEPDPDVGGKQVLIQVAIEDAQVTNVGAQIQARAFGAATVAPQTKPVWGVEEKQPGFVGNAYVEWQYSDVPDPPVENVPPNKDLDPHECPRRQPAAQEQLRDFLETGVVNQYCDGICEDVRANICG